MYGWCWQFLNIMFRKMCGLWVGTYFENNISRTPKFVNAYLTYYQSTIVFK